MLRHQSSVSSLSRLLSTGNREARVENAITFFCLFSTQMYDILVKKKSLVLFHQKTASTTVFVRSPDPVSGQEYTFGVASQTVCGYGERTTLTIYYPG